MNFNVSDLKRMFYDSTLPALEYPIKPISQFFMDSQSFINFVSRSSSIIASIFIGGVRLFFFEPIRFIVGRFRTGRAERRPVNKII